MVFCGEAPGKDEVLNREGFVGPAGKVLQKIIYTSGLSWSDVGRTNVVKRAPDGGFDSEHFLSTFYTTTRVNRKKVVAPTDELLAWYQALAVELAEQAPNVVVACGQEALKALCEVSGISKYRGSVLPSTLVKGLKVVPLMHPSWIQRKRQWQELYISGRIVAEKVLPQSRSKELSYLEWDELLAPTINQVADCIRYLIGERIPYALDIETRAGGVACVGLAYRPFDGVDRAICIPIQTTTGPYFTLEEEASVWGLLTELLATNPNLVGQNIFYDLAWLREYGVLPSGLVDIMLLFQRMYPELPKGLAFLNMLYNDIPYYKDDGKTWGKNEPDARLWSYNIKDCVATLRVYFALCELARDQFKQEAGIYQDYTAKIMPIAFEMQVLGLDADVAGVELARGVLSRELETIRLRLDQLSQGELVVLPGNSKITDQQKHKFLYKTLGLPVKRKQSTQRVTAEEDAIVELMITHPKLEVLKCILAEGKFFKALSSYIDIEWA